VDGSAPSLILRAPSSPLSSCELHYMLSASAFFSTFPSHVPWEMVSIFKVAVVYGLLLAVRHLVHGDAAYISADLIVNMAS
jgi:hypothetical protein